MTDIGRMRVPARRVIASVAAIATLLVAVQLSSPQSVSADELCSAGAALNVVAHEDDDLLFQSTTLVSDIESGLCVRTVFVTAGEADHTDAAYWQGREAGSKAAYAQMAGVADDWTTSDAGVAGYSITMETLVAAPKISLVFMRLPDSYVNGWYGNNANGESLQGLFENTVPTIHSIASPIQSYTIDQLRNTLTELMTNFQPTSINTQDFVGHYGDSDHSDHHTVAYLTLQAQAKYAAPHTFTGYRGYVIESQPANLTPSQIAQKQAIFFTYAAFDPETCDSVPACAARAEASWLQRQYEATPPIFVPGSNIAGSAVVQASSQDPTQPALAAVDGVVGGYPDDSANEWSTLGGGAGSWLSLSWASPVVLDQVVLFDRPNTADQVTGGTLTFSDGSTVVVPALTNDGSAVPISFSPRATSSVLFTVNSVSANTVNIGLAEIQTRMHEPVDLDSSTPVLTGGVKVGQTVGVSPGTWGPATVAFAYQWMRDGEPIAGATSSTYVPVNTDAGSLLSVTVTGSADYYLPTSESSAATMVTGGTLTSSAPEISGSAVVGGAVSVSAGAWGPGSVSLTYQWMRGGVAIVGATSSSFMPTVADFGKSVTVAVTGTRTGFDAVTEVSDGVTIGPGALVSSVPSVSGTMVSGQVLTANSQVWGPGAVDLSYQWKRNGAAINGATGNTYTLVPADVSSVVTVTVTGIKVGYVSKSLSSVSTDSVSAPISRGAGADRYATSAAISAASFAPGVPVVYVASGEAFPDALSAAPVAGPGGGPVLLVTPSGIPASIRAELVRLKPSRIVVVGGPASITDVVFAQLQQFAPGHVSRLAGADRYATSAAISAASFAPGVPVVYVASGEAFPDALSAAPVAGPGGGPVLLVTPSGIPASIRAELVRLKPSRIVVVGGPASITDVVFAQLQQFAPGHVSRLAGADRYATSAAISAASFAPGVPVVYVASGEAFPDALSAAPVAGPGGGPVLLVTPSGIPASIRAELVRLKPSRIVVVGGPASITDALYQEFLSYVVK